MPGTIWANVVWASVYVFNATDERKNNNNNKKYIYVQYNAADKLECFQLRLSKHDHNENVLL